MSRTHEVSKFTVTKTGTEYEPKDVPKDIKEATVEVTVSQEGTVIGTYEAHGWAESGDIYYVLPDDWSTQLEASQPRTASPAPTDEDKVAASKALNTKK